MTGSGNDETNGSLEHASRWDDPAIPIGNAPPQPRWPLVLAGLAWLAWVSFLFMTMLSRGA